MIMSETKTPKASVASARYRPRRRSAGSAIRPPTTAVTAIPINSPHGVIRCASPVPERPRWNTMMVAIAPKETGARLISPA